MLIFRIFCAAAALILLSGFGGIGGFGVGYDIERLRDAQATGSPFTQALTEQYRQIALFEADEMYDWPDAGYFARKGLRAAKGEVVEPEAVEDWDLPDSMVGELSSARSELVSLFGQGAREKAPELAARAQGRYDCWIEQQEENFQTDHIAACRAEFLAALAALKEAMAPKAVAAQPQPQPAPPPPMAAPETFLVFFEFDKSDITSQGMTVIENALAAARRHNVTEFSVTGHADRAGPADYNIGLSLRRANAVRDALVARGVNPGNIGIAGRGEAEPAVPTADGVREPANRRVEIILVQ